MQRTGRRLLIYSHDSFGLGHLRRCRTIAHALVDRYDDLSVIILSGSPIIGSFDFKYRVDFVRIPGVIKRNDGDYTSLQLPLDIEQTVQIRSSIIQHTADVFDPHMFLVDKEPLGLRGEVRPTLEMLRGRGTHCVLGLRDVMDDPVLLQDEWERKSVVPALKDSFDEIWIYGLPEIHDPLSEISGTASLRSKVRFTGYLKRELPKGSLDRIEFELPEEPFILVTPGGGGDGEALIDWVLRAYEHDKSLRTRALILFGPFMNADVRRGFLERIQELDCVHAVTFAAEVEGLFEKAAAVVAMGGYNTFCEILSFAKPALIVPRTKPRREQLLRAQRASDLGLARMLVDDRARDPATMAYEIRTLADRSLPSRANALGLLCGLENVAELARPHLSSDGREDRGPLIERRSA